MFEVDDLVKMLGPDGDQKAVIEAIHAAAKRESDRMSETPEGDARERQALIAGRLWGAADLSRRMVVWGETREIIPPRPRRADEPLNEHKHGTEWVVSAALSWPPHAVDVLDRELFGLAVGGEDDKARSYGWRMRGALEVALAWRTAALVSDRYDVPVTRPDVDVDDLRSKVAARLEEAERDGMSMLAGTADSVSDRLRAADMATGRAQAFRQILRLLDQAPRYAVDSDEEDCEGCGEVAVTRDSEGVPLCAACYDDLPLVCGHALDAMRCELPKGHEEMHRCGRDGRRTAMRFDEIDRRPARGAGQAKTEPIAQIGDLDRRTGPLVAARRALVALTLLAAAGMWWFFVDAPGTAAACVLAFSIASSGWAATSETA